MTNLIIAKFGGSAIGPDGVTIPKIIERINNLKKDSKVIAVFSAPLTVHDGKRRSLTDVVLEQGKNAENGIKPSLDIVKATYQKILQMVNEDNKKNCENVIDIHLKKAQKSLDDAFENKEFANEIRSRSLAFSGEILMSHVMNHILRSNQINADAWLTTQVDADWCWITLAMSQISFSISLGQCDKHRIQCCNYYCSELRDFTEK